MSATTRRFVALLEHATTAAAYGFLLTLLIATAVVPAAQTEPTQMVLRPATEQERRDHDRQRLADALDELRQNR